MRKPCTTVCSELVEELNQSFLKGIGQSSGRERPVASGMSLGASPFGFAREKFVLAYVSDSRGASIPDGEGLLGEAPQLRQRRGVQR